MIKSFATLLLSTLAWISGLSLFVTGGTILLILSFFFPPKRFDPLIKAACRMLIRFLFIRINVRGYQPALSQQTCLFMANHVNLFDVFVLYGYIPNYLIGVELDKHFTWPLYGPIIRRMGMIPISHTNGRSALQSLNQAKQALANAISILILPEGHRTRTGRLGPFKRGAFLLAKEAGADIVPVVMIGAYHINRKGSLLIRPGKMILQFGQVIPYRDIEKMASDEIALTVRQKMIALLAE